MPGGTGETRDLPTDLGRRPETISTGTVRIRNRYPSRRGLTLSIAYDGTVFFRCSYRIEGGESIVVPDVTSRSGTYDVAATLDTGARVETEWRVPSRDEYPLSDVAITGPDELHVGCGERSPVEVDVANAAGGSRTASLALVRDGASVARSEVDLAAGDRTQVRLPIPIGDVYTLSVTAAGGSDRTELPVCYCYREHRTTVELTGAGPEVTTSTRVCQ